MNIELNFLIVFSLITGVNLLVLFLILFFRKNNTLINKCLAGLVLMPGITLLVNPLVHTGGFNDLPFLLYLTMCNAFLFGPLLMLYIHLMSGNKYRFQRKHLLHFSPIITVSVYGAYVQLQSTGYIHDNYTAILAGEDLVTNLIYLAQFLHFTFYITWGMIKVKQYREKIKNYLTTFEGVNYNWLWFFVTRLLVINLLLVAVYIVQMSFFPSYTMYAELLATPLAATCFYPMVVYKSIANRLLFDKTSFNELVDNSRTLFEVESKDTADKSDESPENLERLQLIKLELDIQLQEKKIFTTPQLSVQKLADEIGCSRTILSRTINRLYETTFFDLVNSYRVEEATKLLLDPKSVNIKIDSIGEMAGFSSRTSFFTVFKKSTNLSPSAYREQHQ